MDAVTRCLAIHLLAGVLAGELKSPELTSRQELLQRIRFAQPRREQQKLSKNENCNLTYSTLPLRRPRVGRHGRLSVTSRRRRHPLPPLPFAAPPPDLAAGSLRGPRGRRRRGNPSPAPSPGGRGRGRRWRGSPPSAWRGVSVAGSEASAAGSGGLGAGSAARRHVGGPSWLRLRWRRVAAVSARVRRVGLRVKAGGGASVAVSGGGRVAASRHVMGAGGSWTPNVTLTRKGSRDRRSGDERRGSSRCGETSPWGVAPGWSTGAGHGGPWRELRRPAV